ncbi:methyltransferase domain-containing protein [Phthorimaea operculella]|nr:methyltransferase domain-containing protein [Phthorimaea operculella]
MSMHKPEMYEKFIAFQKRDAVYCLQKFSDKMNWKQNCTVIDLGCGDGFVTTTILKKYLPSVKKLIGADISKEMVDFANSKYSDDRTSFVQMDVAGDVPNDFRGAFDHAFSSYVLQFIPDQESAFINIYNLLTDGGTCLLQFLGHTLLYNPYIELANQEKWRFLAKDIDNLVTSYYYMDDPTVEVKRLMKAAGFRNIHVEANKTSFEYETYDHLRNMVECANLFHLSPELLKEFMNDFDKVVFDHKCVESIQGTTGVKLNYTQIIAYGSK